MTDNNPGPKRIAILGAGPAGLSAAWELMRSTPQDYDITIYDMSWRPGGKCASGRLESSEHRIVQNGTHYLFGVFLNTLQFIKETYDVLNHDSDGESDDHAGWGGTDELVPRELVAVKQGAANHDYDNWLFRVPCKGADPFPSGDADDALGLQEIIELIEEILSGYYKSLGVLGDDSFSWSSLFPSGQDKSAGPPNPDLFDDWQAVGSSIKDLGSVEYDSAELKDAAERREGQLILEALDAFTTRLEAELDKSIPDRDEADKGLDAELDAARRGVDRIRTVTDFGQALLVGIVEDLLNDRTPIEQLDRFEIKDWLRAHGAKPQTVDGPLMGTWYDAIAAYEDGAADSPSFSTAAFLQSVVAAALKYRGCFVYQMMGEIGENLSGPLYQALVNRGVKFRWLHRVANLKLSADKSAVDEVLFEVPVRASDDADDDALPSYDELLAYDPTIEFELNNGKIRKSFPHRPKAPFEFMAPAVDGGMFYVPAADGGSHKAIRRREVAAGDDEVYDELVFAMPHAVVPHVAGELVDARPAWRNLEQLPTVETRSLRLWLRPEFQQLNWDALEDDTRPILAMFRHLFFVWEDSGQQLAVHTWDAGAHHPPQSIASVFAPNRGSFTAPPRDDAQYAVTQTQAAMELATEFLRSEARHLWPGIKAANRSDLDQTAFASFTGTNFATLEEALTEQYVIANVSPTERYVHAAPGTFRFRLNPFDTGFRNLYAAGDWIKLWPATGNMELAVLSGRIAAGRIRGMTQQQMEHAFWNYPGLFR